MDAAIGYKCQVCGAVIGVMVGPPVHCGRPMVPAGDEAPRVAANVVCSHCGTGIGLALGYPSDRSMGPRPTIVP